MLFEIKDNNNPTRRREFLFIKTRMASRLKMVGFCLTLSISHIKMSPCLVPLQQQKTLFVRARWQIRWTQSSRLMTPHTSCSLNISHITALVVLVQSSCHPNIGNSLIKTLYWPLRLNSFMLFMEYWRPKWSIYRPFLYQPFEETNWTQENIGFFIEYFEETITRTYFVFPFYRLFDSSIKFR